MAMINPAELELREETVVRVNRVAKVTARGKRFRFASIVVVGDGKGHVGIGQVDVGSGDEAHAQDEVGLAGPLPAVVVEQGTYE